MLDFRGLNEVSGPMAAKHQLPTGLTFPVVIESSEFTVVESYEGEIRE
jgi:hypothetical protein